MRSVVIFESMFGNTEAVARAIGRGLEAYGPVEVQEVSQASAAVDDADLLVLGGPTHAFSMSRAATRDDARENAAGGTVSPDHGIREWIAESSVAEATPVAVFDTKAHQARRMPGSARAAARALRRRGRAPVVRPESFWVDGREGPLREGELDRATRWAADLGRRTEASV